MSTQNSEFDPDIVYRQAIGLHQSGRLIEAAPLYKKLLARFPKHPDLLTRLGTLALQLGNLEEAIKLLGLSLEERPNQTMALSNRGLAFQYLGRLYEAIQNYELAISLQPDNADAHNNLGNALQELKRPSDAVVCFDRAITLRPDFAEAHCNRGNALRTCKRLDAALASYERAISLQPSLAEAYNNRASVLHDLNRFDDAIASIERAISLRPDFAEAHDTCGTVLLKLGRLEEAHASYDRATAIKPDYAMAWWHKSILSLLTGDYEQGWRLYEWGWKSFGRGNIRDFGQPPWQGEERISGSTVLIHSEQGLGDIIQFCRYANLLDLMGAKVVLEVPPSLITLVSTLRCRPRVVEFGKSLPHFDLHCPIMSLPLALRTTVETIPTEVPYLYAEDEKRKVVRGRLGDKKRPRVGLVWSGTTVHPNDHNRSIPLRHLETLLQLPMDFHALQKDIRPDDAVVLSKSKQVCLHQNELRDFSYTAAFVQEMDLVISVDTSVAHLAGALGQSVWILLPFFPDYRWMLDREDSPWYPTATLFRQKETGNWLGVVSEVVQRLQKMEFLTNPVLHNPTSHILIE